MFRIIRQIAYRASIRDKIKAERETRLGKVGEAVLPTRAVDSLALIRNIGIIAHIDAGKTTTTQRMLYYAGALPSPGDIDEGTTTMDYMKQERQRGITIRSAAISFSWNKCQINLIDTPGHVDFSGQVARSLRVLDGAVTILDGGKGVETQTIKVWQQASKRSIPKLCFINKLDRIGSSVLRTAQAIQKFLNIQPLMFQIASGQGEHFKGVIDLITMKEIRFGGKYGENVIVSDVKQDHVMWEQSSKKRLQLIQRIANYDDVIGQLYLNQQKITNPVLKTAIRRMMNNPLVFSKVTPIFLGASLRNQGVQPLLDAIVDYLPSPTERPPVVSTIDSSMIRQPIKSQRLSGYAFKVICDSELGALAYTRIYSGQLKKSSNLLNSSKGYLEKTSNIYRVRANQYVPINEAVAGDIVAIAGLRETRAGDTLTDPGDGRFQLQNLELPAAIFTMPIELNSKNKLNQFMAALNRAVLEDNSLIFRQQKQTGQYLLSGLGELHLQIIKDRLIQEGIDVKLGKLKIGYRQTVRDIVKKQLVLRNQLKNGNFQQFQLEIEIAPLRQENGSIEDKVSVIFTFPKVQGFQANWREFLMRKHISKTGRRDEDQTKQDYAHSKTKIKKSFNNPTPIEPIQSQENQDQLQMIDEQQDPDQQETTESEQYEDEEGKGKDDSKKQEQDPYYHINTLPFDTLHQLVQQCKVALLSGNFNYPIMGVELRICGGKFQKKHFSKAIMNRTASQLTRQLLSSSVLIEPFLQFRLEGEASMIDGLVKDVLKRRGQIDEQTETVVKGQIPGASVRGWIKELRVMGMEVDMKFVGYQQVTGIDPKKLVEENL